MSQSFSFNGRDFWSSTFGLLTKICVKTFFYKKIESQNADWCYYLIRMDDICLNVLRDVKYDGPSNSYLKSLFA